MGGAQEHILARMASSMAGSRRRRSERERDRTGRPRATKAVLLTAVTLLEVIDGRHHAGVAGTGAGVRAADRCRGPSIGYGQPIGAPGSWGRPHRHCSKAGHVAVDGGGGLELVTRG